MELILDLFSRYSRKLATIATTILVVLVTLSVADTALFILDQYNETDTTITNVPKSVGKGSTSTTVSSFDIASLNLFGKLNEKDISAAVEAPETSLSLELQGVFTADSEDQSTAIVAEKNKTGELFHIGDKLPGNAVLSAVFDDHILMQRGTRFETLSFSDDAFRAPPVAQKSQPRKRPTTSTRNRQRPSTGSIQRDTRNKGSSRQVSSGGNKSKFNDASIGDFVNANRQQLEQDPASLLSELGVESVASGEAKGYTLAGDVPPVILQKSGLQRGDVILSVNGQPVGNAMADSSLVASAMAQGRIRVEVQRADRRFFVTVPVK
jgi:general secretion pathway protein C